LSNTLNVAPALKNPGQLYPFSADVVVDATEVFGGPVRFAPARIEGSVLGAGEIVKLRGTLVGEAIVHCARCLKEVRVPIRVDVDEAFARTSDPDEPDRYLFEGSDIDLTDCARDLLLLDLPIRAVCSEDCRGLCPTCGENRNLVSCTCLEGEEVANPFSALKAMVENEEEV
jgi:uncharacterized protein